MSGMAPDLVEAVIGADGAILSADAPLVALQRAAGGAEQGPLLIPQLAALVRLARRLNILVSRPVVAAGPQSDVSMWVRARPDGDTVRLSIVDWMERPVLLDLPLRQATPEAWLWEVDSGFRLTSIELPDGEESTVRPGDPLTSWLRPLEGTGGEWPLIMAIAAHRPFERQLADLRADASRRFYLSGQPDFAQGGQFIGYRGKATPLSDAPAVRSGTFNALSADPSATPLADFASNALFGKRLDGALRSPLGRIIANAESIKGQTLGPLQTDYAGYASDIAAAGRHLLALVDDLADLRHIERPQFSVARELVDLADCARRAAGLLGVKAADRSIRVDAPASDEYVPAAGEFRRVLQILVNLIGNAVRYSPEGSFVWVRVRNEDGVARVVVADQGHGIPPEAHQRIFDKFERLGRGEAGGSGLGLYISRRLARAMGGEISVESDSGQGARFTLTLPAWEDDAPQA